MASMVLSDAVRGGAVAREYDKFADMEIIEDTNTADVVRQLAAIDLGHNRCHQITEDAPPDVDPFALVKEELAPLSLEVRAQLEHIPPPPHVGRARAAEGADSRAPASRRGGSRQ